MELPASALDSTVTLPDGGVDAVDPEPPKTVAISGTVALPAGYTGSILELVVESGVETQTPDAQGAFTLQGFDGASQGVMVVDAQGNPLLLGWISPGKENAISTTSTAALLLFVAGGGPLLPAGSWGTLADLIRQSPETAKLALVLDAELLKDSAYLASPTPALFTSLTNALAAITPQFSILKQGLVLVNPAERKSGVRLLIGDQEGNTVADVNRITVMNEFRRRGYVFIDRKVGDLFVEQTAFEMPPTAGLSGVLGSITDAWDGKVVYNPVYLGPIGLGLVATEKKTVYRVRVVGNGASRAPEIVLTDKQQTQKQLTILKFALAHGHTFFKGPFVLDGEKLIYVSEEPNAAPQRLQIRKKDGSDAPQEISLPADTTRVPALAADGSQLFVVLERSTDPRHVVHRLDLPLLNNGQTSVEIGTTIENSIALNSTALFLLADNPPALLKVDRTTLEVMKLADLGSTAGSRTLVRTETHCFWSEWTSGALVQFRLSDSEKTVLTSTNQPLLWDGEQLYSGINGLIRVGPDRTPDTERLFVSSPITLYASDATYIYFAHNYRIWRLRKSAASQ